MYVCYIIPLAEMLDNCICLQVLVLAGSPPLTPPEKKGTEKEETYNI